MYNFKFIFLILLSVNLFSQNKFNEITYDVFSKKINIKNNLNGKIKDTELLKKLNKTFNSSEKLKCILICNKENAIFYKQEKISINESKKSITEILLGDGKYYTSKKQVFEQKTFLDELFLIEHQKINWSLLNEVKVIGEYKCNKAIAEKTITNDAGTFKRKIIAWYTTSIPINFGPKNYSGLPGLIIELEEGQLKYSARKIKLNIEKINFKLEKPKRGRLVSTDEYQNDIKKLFEEYRK